MTGYVRQSSYNDNDTITAAHSNDEFNALVIAMALGTGHKHDGTSDEGAYVPLISNVGNTRKVEVTASGALTTGDHQVTGQIVGDTTITAGTGLTVTTGDLAVSSGNATVSGTVTAGDITVSGTVDGRDVSVDGIKLDGIESGATADQTASEILTAIKTVDGAGSGLDADLLDGLTSSSFLRSNVSDTFTGGSLKVEALSNSPTDYPLGIANSADSLETGYGAYGLSNKVGTSQTSDYTIEVGGDVIFEDPQKLIVNTSTGGEALLLKDTGGAGNAAVAYIGIDDSTGTRQAYMGLGSTSNQDLYINSDPGNVRLLAPTGHVLITDADGGGTVWHTGNDGVGSGLDADLLDGVEGSNYLRSDQSDTINGDLQVNGDVISTGTGAFGLPDGTTAQRPGTPSTGMLRFNTTDTTFEGYNGTVWGPVGGPVGGATGPIGGGSDEVFYENGTTIIDDYTITSNKNAMSAGPITVDGVNRVLYSEQLDNAVWTDPLSSWSVISNNVTDPLSGMTADTITLGVATDCTIRQASVGSVDGETYTSSFWVKSLSANITSMTCSVGGGAESTDIVPTTSWQRISRTVVSGASDYFEVTLNGDIGDTVSIWGIQLEAGDRASSYRQTTDTHIGAVVTVPIGSSWSVV